MPSQHAIEIFALISFAVLGLSLLLQPLAWVRLTAWLQQAGEPGALLIGLISLFSGALIVGFHRVWFGVLTLLTLVGWIQVLKGALFLLAPAAGLRLMAIASENRTGLFRFGGLVSLVLAAVIFVALLPGRF